MKVHAHTGRQLGNMGYGKSAVAHTPPSPPPPPKQPAAAQVMNVLLHTPRLES